MSFTMTWQEAQQRMVSEMAAVSRQFEEHYGADVVAAVLISARERGVIPSDPQDFGALFAGVQRSETVVSLQEARSRNTSGQQADDQTTQPMMQVG